MSNQGKTTFQTVLHYGLLTGFMLFSITLQNAPGGGLTLWGLSPLPAIAFVVGVSMHYGPFIGGVFGLVTGLLLDVYTVPSVGFQTVAITLLGMGCGLTMNHLLLHNKYAKFVLCLVSALLYGIVYFAVMKWMIGGHDFSYFYRFSLPAIGLCTVLCLLYGWVLGWFRRQLNERD